MKMVISINHQVGYFLDGLSVQVVFNTGLTAVKPAIKIIRSMGPPFVLGHFSLGGL